MEKSTATRAPSGRRSSGCATSGSLTVRYRPSAANSSRGCGRLARSTKLMFTKPPPSSVRRCLQVRGLLARRSPPERCSRGRLDPRLGGLGLTFKNTWRGYFSGKTHPGLLARGFTPEFKEQFLEDFDTLKWQIDSPLYCLWARRSA